LQNTVDPNQLPPGSDILDSSGELVGTLDASISEKGYLSVLKGVFFTKGIFLPMSAVDHVSVDGVHLNLRRDELQDSRFASPPNLEEADETPAVD
jgi:hypothetical protein